MDRTHGHVDAKAAHSRPRQTQMEMGKSIPDKDPL